MISKDVAGLIKKYQTSKGTFFANIDFEKIYWSNGKIFVFWCNKPEEWSSIFFAVWHNGELFVNNKKILYKYDVFKNIWINAPKIKMFTLPKVFPLHIPNLPIEDRYYLNWDNIGNTSEDLFYAQDAMNYFIFLQKMYIYGKASIFAWIVLIFKMSKKRFEMLCIVILLIQIKQIASFAKKLFLKIKI